jgi:hypothetical protein
VRQRCAQQTGGLTGRPARPPSNRQERLDAAERKRQARLEAVRLRASALGGARRRGGGGAGGGPDAVRLQVHRGLSLDEEASTPKRLVMQRMVRRRGWGRRAGTRLLLVK